MQLLLRSSLGAFLLLLTAACGDSTPPPAAAMPTTSASATPMTAPPPAAGTGKEGDSCGDGIMGAPKIACAPGLVCEMPSSTAPGGPPGAAASAKAGTCKKAK